jgi:patatin-related protein
MPNDNDEELRFALVMSGGVSLAVWMGGVTEEIFRVVQRQHPVYSRLLALTHTTPRVDVISGTSAGGINGAALAVALLYGGEFSTLRDVWMQTANFDDLLRKPIGGNPGSLLMGDEYFLPGIRQALERLAVNPHAVCASTDRMPLDLRLTTTLLSGRQGGNVDDLGTPVNDVDYRGSFHFRHDPDQDDFTQRATVLDQLARAARSSASFPFAFEPSCIDGTPQAPRIEDVFGDTLITPRYVVDGGLLDNKPLRGALDAMFRMRRERGVRRVLLYVNPDPGDGPPRQVDGSMPPLSRVLTASLLGIPQSQTISDQLQEIANHNETVRHRRDNVLTLVTLGADKLAALADTLYPVYRQRRIADAFQCACNDLQTAMPPLPARLLGKRGREQLRHAFDAIPWETWIPLGWPAKPDDPANQRDTWAWGLFPVEFSIKVLLDLLRLTQNLLDYALPGPPENAAASSRPTPSPAGAPTSPDWSDSFQRAGASPASARRLFGGFWSRSVLGNSERKRASLPVWHLDDADREPDEAAAQASPHALVSHWKQAYLIVDQTNAQRRNERTQWDLGAAGFVRQLHEHNPALDADPTSGIRILSTWFSDMFRFVGTDPRRARCAELMSRIVDLLGDASRTAVDVATESLASQRLRPVDHRQAASLLALARYLGAHEMDAPVPPAQRLHRLLQLEVIEFAFHDHDKLAEDTLIELVQISGNARSPIGGPDTARQKLLGLQFAHFAAFYKRSWRANDWTYGRLDGAERLLKVLLNPERLHRFFLGRADDAHVRIRDIAYDSVPSAVLKGTLKTIWDNKGYDALLRAELAYLQDSDAPLPDSLPVCAEILTLRLHYGILREELPALYDAIAWDQAEGADQKNAGDAMLRERCCDHTTAYPFSPEDAARKLSDGLLSSENLLEEAGSDLFTRTLAHTLATLQGTLASKAASLGPVSLLFASLKLPILGFYFVAQGLTHQSRTSATLNGAIFALGVLLVALQDILMVSLPEAIVTIGWVLTAYGTVMAVTRVPRSLATLLALFALVGVGWLLRHFHWITPDASFTAVLLAELLAVFTLLAALGALMLIRLLSPAIWDLFQFLAGLVFLFAVGVWSSGRSSDSSGSTPHVSGAPYLCADTSAPAFWKAWDAYCPAAHLCSPIVLSTLVIIGAILLASWQATNWSRHLEQWLRTLYGGAGGSIGKTAAWIREQGGKIAAVWRRLRHPSPGRH